MLNLSLLGYDVDEDEFDFSDEDNIGNALVLYNVFHELDEDNGNQNQFEKKVIIDIKKKNKEQQTP
ncbi:hypothetical protein MNBD_GAMMA12-2608 [hydrothermal vent metagenome]|uniref:Uncharacterized protein n=1 Tax=hydrothermal vent metagenome TaxID=652676 RepID=A0A3B0YL77_9ZZZZ